MSSYYEEVEQTVDETLNFYQHNPEYLPLMVERLSYLFPEIGPAEFKDGLMLRLSTATEEMIAKTDLYDAHLMGDKESSIAYLRELYPNFSRKEIKKQLELPRKYVIPIPEEPAKIVSSTRRNKTITTDDINEAVEFYGFQFGPDLKDKVIKYMMVRYPSLGRDEIIKQLSGTDFGDQPNIESSNSWSPRATPPPRRSMYQASDFSPSSYGAASLGAMDFYKEKRTKHLPDYVSPSRTPWSPSRRGMPTPKRFREDFTPPPQTPKRPKLVTSGRRLSFSRPSSPL